MGVVIEWPTVEPGRPYRWLLNLDLDKPAPTCVKHRERTNGLGICYPCVSEWRESLGFSPDEWTDCRICLYPIHPAAEVGGFDTCPSCDTSPVARIDPMNEEFSTPNFDLAIPATKEN